MDVGALWGSTVILKTLSMVNVGGTLLCNMEVLYMAHFNSWHWLVDPIPFRALSVDNNF